MTRFKRKIILFGANLIRNIVLCLKMSSESGFWILRITIWMSRIKIEKKERQNVVEHTRPHVYRCARKDQRMREGRVCGVNRTWTDDVQCMFYP